MARGSLNVTVTKINTSKIPYRLSARRMGQVSFRGLFNDAFSI